MTTSTLDVAEFRSIVGHFATGVTVITTVRDGERFGTTASAFSSLSLEPPSVLVCLNRSSTTNPVIAETGVFAVNILADDQAGIARRFGARGPDKFDGTPIDVHAATGIPLIEGALATIVCEVMDAPVGGTHTVYFGRVIDAHARAGEPLAYYRGQFGRFAEYQI
ncbi:MAG: flavin reductase family protein [Microbacteriaceae bacterium]|nr:flavin reductase family protein [Microbacteriaceae bacterium]